MSPNYDYSCINCNVRREVFKQFDEEYTPNCDTCGMQMERLWSATPTIFKTGGFYKTDNR